MSSKRRPTSADYEEMSASYAADPIRPEEIRSVTVGPGLLRMGRPTKDTASAGKSPALSTRYPAELRDQITETADAEGITESELVRKAVAEYVARRNVTAIRDPHLVKILGMKCEFETKTAAVFAARDALQKVALHRTGFEVTVTANPTIVETNGTLDLDDLIEHFTTTSTR